jgi:AbrB family looped-hinge helix DNA binding protein
LETTVTRKGQVTIPIQLRKKYGIREGMKVDVTESEKGGAIVLKPVPSVKDWAGADTGRYTYSEAVEKLDRLRRKWR